MTAITSHMTPVGAVSPIAALEPPPQASHDRVHQHDLHDTTPTGLPSWYGQKVGREERSWLSKTGDVELFIGNTFGISYGSYKAAVAKAVEASPPGEGAVLVMSPVGHDVHAGRFYLARPYNAEYKVGTGLVVGRTHVDGAEKYSNWHPEVHAVVDGNVVRPTQQRRP